MNNSAQAQFTDNEVIDIRWKGLYKVGGIAAIIMIVLIPVQSFMYILYPPSDTVNGYFTLLQRNWLLGLLDLDLLYILDSTLMIPIYLALYAALRRTSPSYMVLALALALVGLAAFFASNTSFEMLSLSKRYATATSDAEKTALLAAGQAMLGTYSGTSFDVYYIFNAVALLIFSFVMLQCSIFSRATAILGIVAGVLMLVPSTAGTLGIYFSLASLVPWTIWLILFAGRLFKLVGHLKEQSQNIPQKEHADHTFC